MLEDAGHRRHRQGKLSLRYIRNVIQHARNKDGSLDTGRGSRGGEGEAPADPFGELRHVLRMRGWPEHRIAQRIGMMREMDRQTAEAEAEQRDGFQTDIAERIAEALRQAAIRTGRAKG